MDKKAIEAVSPQLIKEHYKSDFKRTCRFLMDGTEGCVPVCDFDLIFTTPMCREPYVASKRGRVYTNCIDRQSELVVLFENHRLGLGRIQMTFVLYIPDRDFKDGTQTRFATQDMDTELTAQVTSTDDVSREWTVLGSYKTTIAKPVYDYEDELNRTEWDSTRLICNSDVVTITFPRLESVTTTNNQGRILYNCTSLKAAYFPVLASCQGWVANQCNALQTLSLPLLTSSGYVANQCSPHIIFGSQVEEDGTQSINVGNISDSRFDVEEGFGVSLSLSNMRSVNKDDLHNFALKAHDFTEGETHTLRIQKKHYPLLTEEDVATLTAKNWTIIQT